MQGCHLDLNVDDPMITSVSQVCIDEDRRQERLGPRLIFETFLPLLLRVKMLNLLGYNASRVERNGCQIFRNFTNKLY
jgi:hypothetical protein